MSPVVPQCPFSIPESSTSSQSPPVCDSSHSFIVVNDFTVWMSTGPLFETTSLRLGMYDAFS